MFPELLGTYVQNYEASTDHPAYEKDGHTMFYLDDKLHHYQGWTLSDSFTDIGPVTNEGEADCAEKADGDWEYLDAANNDWKTDATLSITCVDISQCCESVTMSSSGAASERYPALMGTYQASGQYQHGKPVYSHSDDSGVQLQYINDVGHHWSGWVVGEGMGTLSQVSPQRICRHHGHTIV